MRRLFFPFLIAIHPAIASFAGPGKWEPLEDNVRPAGVLFAAFLLIWLFLAKAMSNAARAAFALSAFWFVFFAYGDVDFVIGNTSPWMVCAALILLAALGAFGTSFSRHAKNKAIWPIATIVITASFALLAKPLLANHAVYASLWCAIVAIYTFWAASVQDLDRKIPYLNVITLGLMILPIAGTLSAVQEAKTYEAKLTPATLTTGIDPAQHQPDVYLFVLDAYGRQDALKRTFGYDNTPFIQALRRRGFYIALHSRSNYAQTEQSLSSELNGNYLTALLPQASPDSHNRSLFKNLVDDNAMAKAMSAHGYRYAVISTGFPLINRDTDDNRLSDPRGMSLAEQLILYRTPEAGLCLFSTYFHRVHRDRIINAFDEAATLSQISQPRFVLIHILAPHPPFVFDANGNPTQPQHRQFGLWDADGFVDLVGSKAEYFKGYPQQLQYVNKLVLRTVDAILAKSKVKPVIILEGDHGSRKEHNMTTLDQTDPTESYENLMAVLAPSAVQKNLYPSITPVNVTRAVLSGLFGGQFQKLPDKSLYSTWDNPYRYVDVTARVN